MSGEPALRVHDLCIERPASGFRLEVDALELRRGEALAILGPNGAGKSTLLRGLAGLERGARGAVEKPGAGPVTMVFQHPAAFAGTVEHNLRVALLASRLAAGEKQQAVDEALERFGIRALRARRAHALSGGELRRLALARAFVLNPASLLLDEPFDDLDAAGQAALSRDLRRVIEETGVAAAVVTHDLRRALLLADRIAVLIGGRLVQVDVRDAVLDRPASRDVALLVGMTNLAPGVMGAGRVEIDALHQVPAVDPPTAGTRVWAGIRPEDLKLDDGAGTAPLGKGYVSHVVNDGTAATVQVEWGSLELSSVLLADDPRARSLARGDAVSLAVRPERVHLMPREP
ncbi:MAG: ABC transporter ATP-binding protein [Myxococcota bacterium]